VYVCVCVSELEREMWREVVCVCACVCVRVRVKEGRLEISAVTALLALDFPSFGPRLPTEFDSGVCVFSAYV